MNSWMFVALGVLMVSVAMNAFQLYLSRSNKRIPRSQSIELQEFLLDLRSGGGILEVRRIDPNDVLLRSPKNR